MNSVEPSNQPPPNAASSPNRPQTQPTPPQPPPVPFRQIYQAKAPKKMPALGSGTTPHGTGRKGEVLSDKPMLQPERVVAKDRRPAQEDRNREESWLDPTARALAQGMPLQPVVPNAQPAPERLEMARSATLEQLFPALVRKVAWSLSPDRQSGTIRFEVAEGHMEGASIMITADPHELHIQLDAPAGVDLEAWKERLRSRLSFQGLTVTVS